MTYKPTRLSAEAFEELRTIVKSEIKESVTDEEIEEMGIKLLTLFSTLLTPRAKVAEDRLTERERKAL